MTTKTRATAETRKLPKMVRTVNLIYATKTHISVCSQAHTQMYTKANLSLFIFVASQAPMLTLLFWVLTALELHKSKPDLGPESPSSYQNKPDTSRTIETEIDSAIVAASQDVASNADHVDKQEGDDDDDIISNSDGFENNAGNGFEAEDNSDGTSQDDDSQAENSDVGEMGAYDGDSSSLEEDDGVAAMADRQSDAKTPPILKSKSCGKRMNFEDLKKALLACDIPAVPTQLFQPPLEDQYTLHAVTRSQMPFEDLRDMFFGVKESLLTSASFKLDNSTEKSSRDSTDSHDSHSSVLENSNVELDSNDDTESDGNIMPRKRNVSKQPRVISRPHLTEGKDKENEGEHESGDVDEEGGNGLDNENKEGNDSSSYGSTTDEDDQDWFCKCCKNWMPNSASECSKCHAKKGQSPPKTEDSPRTMETWRCEECDIWMLASVRRCSICRGRSPATRKRKSKRDPGASSSSKRVRPSGDRPFKKIKRKRTLFHDIVETKRRRNSSGGSTGKKSVRSKPRRQCCAIAISLTLPPQPFTMFSHNKTPIFQLCVHTQSAVATVPVVAPGRNLRALSRDVSAVPLLFRSLFHPSLSLFFCITKLQYFSFVCICRALEFQITTTTT